MCVLTESLNIVTKFNLTYFSYKTLFTADKKFFFSNYQITFVLQLHNITLNDNVKFWIATNFDLSNSCCQHVW